MIGGSVRARLRGANFAVWVNRVISTTRTEVRVQGRISALVPTNPPRCRRAICSPWKSPRGGSSNQLRKCRSVCRILNEERATGVIEDNNSISGLYYFNTWTLVDVKLRGTVQVIIRQIYILSNYVMNRYFLRQDVSDWISEVWFEPCLKKWLNFWYKHKHDAIKI